MRNINLGRDLFIKNRKKYFDKVGGESVSVFTSNDFLPSNADGSFGFIQNSSFFYLTGIDQEDSFLILGPEERSLLFIKETSDDIRVWEGDKLTKREAKNISGIREVFWLEEFWPKLEEFLKDHQSIFLCRDTIQLSRFPAYGSKSQKLFYTLSEKFPQIEVKNNERILWQLRQYKEEEELGAVKRAIETTKKGFVRAAKSLNPGKYEYEIEADITHEFMINGSRYHAFSPIIASGVNSCVLHYINNNRQIKDNEVVLIDFGAEYANYNADITRVLPSSGKFTDRQAEVYQSVLDVLKTLQALMVTGNTVIELKKEAITLITDKLIKLKLLTKADIKRDEKAVLKYFPHGVSHSLGLDVHDVGEKSTKLKSGMILTCEPGIYIREEGIGIRLENDIFITGSGNINLSENIPIEINDIENLMK